MTTTEPASSARLRPVTWTTWLAWVLVCALVPVFCTIAASAFGKPVTRSAEYPRLIVTGLVLLVAASLIVPTLLQGFVLKRILPRLSVTAWFFCIVASTVLLLAVIIGGGLRRMPLIEAALRSPALLQLAGERLGRTSTLNVVQILSLPWAPMLLWTLVSSALTSLGPAAALGVAARLWRLALVCFTASVVGALAAAVVEQLYALTWNSRFIRTWTPLNGLSWMDRLQLLMGRAGIGAVWGATTALIFVRMSSRLSEPETTRSSTFAAHRAGGYALLLIAPVLLAVLAPFVGYLAGPRGLVAGAPELRWALTRAPTRDRSQGETVLTYSHDVAVAIAPRSGVVIAPDARSAFVRSIDQALMQIDLATGQAVRQLAGPLGQYERYEIVWSPDGRYLALRSDGADAQVSHIRDRSRQSRMRLYTLPDLMPVAEFSDREGRCATSYARETMLFSGDSKTLWLLCGQSTAPKPDDTMAIGLDIAAMQIVDTRRYGQAAESGPIQGIQRAGDSAWVWQFPSVTLPFRIRDLTLDRDIVSMSLPTTQIGNLTRQTGNSKLNEKIITLQFCGTPGAARDAGPASWICRTLTFDTQTGSLLGSIDTPDHRVGSFAPDRPRSTLSDHGLQIEAYWSENSKAGEIVVRDGATGRERQRIVSIAQRPLQISADGVWLMTVGVYSNGLRLYRIQR